ncbi:MAG: hypothetical protein VXW20_06025, partial [Pseudomonadota bacterium]|nr:hypothetical protein [Pseudomonadota bacterium]
MLSEKLVEKPPGTVTPHQRRRARRYFTLSFFFLLFMALWLLTDYVLPDPNKAGLSARPAPAPTLIMTNWQDITPMHRRSRTAALKKSDSLAALLAREGIEPVAADAALDTLQEVFDARGDIKTISWQETNANLNKWKGSPPHVSLTFDEKAGMLLAISLNAP